MHARRTNGVWIFVALVFLAGLIVSCGVRAASAAGPAAREGCAAPHHARGQHSLRYIAWHQTHGDVAYLLTATLRCNGGTRYPAFLQFYLNNADLSLPVPKGTRLWFAAPGIGEPLARSQP